MGAPLLGLSKIFQPEKRNLVAPSSHVIFYLLISCKASKGTIFICNYINSDLFTYENTCNMLLSSRAKISCFHVKTNIFHWCLYNKSI